MRILLLTAALCAGLTGTAMAAGPADGRTGEIPAAADKATPKAPETRAEKLDWLFVQLKAAANEPLAKRIASQINAIFLESGSDTIDLLMSRAMKAMADKDSALALDLLDQVVVLKPDYVEGWNKRATLHYMEDRYGPALADIEHVLALEPRHYGALSGLGMILGELNDKRRAIEAFKNVLALYPQLENAKKALADLEKDLRERDI